MSDFNAIMDFYPGNRVAYKHLSRRINEKAVVPFIGAGLSAFCYPTWYQLLEGMLSSVSGDCAERTKKLMISHDYFSAANALCDEMGELLFYEIFRDAFSESKISEDVLKKQAVYLLPRFRFKTYITTNYDRVLENAFSYNNMQYEVGFPYDTYRLTSYLRNTISNPMLLKIHGDIRSDRDNLILTGKSYDIHYQNGACLKDQLSRWADSKNFLFLGASLYKDKTISTISDRMQEGMINYTIMGVDLSEMDTVKNRISKLNVMPIFYDQRDHSNLAIILQQLIKDQI